MRYFQSISWYVCFMLKLSVFCVLIHVFSININYHNLSLSSLCYPGDNLLYMMCFLHNFCFTYIDFPLFTGSPFQCLVDQVDGGYVSVFGPGLVGGMCGQNESFTVVAKRGALRKYEKTPCHDSTCKIPLTNKTGARFAEQRNSFFIVTVFYDNKQAASQQNYVKC